MGYLFGAANADNIAVSGLTAWSSKVSVAARFKLTAANSLDRRILVPTGAGAPLLFDFSSVGTNSARLLYQDSGSSYQAADWTSGFTAGTVHTLVGTIDLTLGSNNIKLYADTDATPKAQATSTLAPLDAGTAYAIGGKTATTDSLDGPLYEFAYWPTVALTGDQAAQFGAGFDARFLNPKPSNHWRLIADARDGIGNAHGTVTGATLVPHNAQIYYPAPPMNRRFIAAAPATSPAYVVGAGATDKIDCGTGVGHAATWSVALRLRPTGTPAAVRRLIQQTVGTESNVFLLFNGLANNNVTLGFSKTAGTVFPATAWESNFGTGTLHTLVGTYNGATLLLYADSDATAKSALAETGTPDQNGAEVWTIGNAASGTESADATIYEVAWYPGVVLTGAQAALLGGGGAMPVGFPLPAHYWPLVTDADDFYGAADGVVTGTTTGALVGTSWFPLAGAPAFNLLLLQPSGGGRGD